MIEYLFLSAYLIAPLLLAMGVVAFFAGAVHWGRSRELGLVPYIFYPVLFGAAFGVLLSGRNLYLPELFVDPAMTKNALSAWVSRATSLFIVFAAGERLIKHILGQENKRETPFALIVAFLFFFITNIVCGAALGTHPSFSHVYFYSVLSGCAALLLAPQEGETAISSARNALFVFLLVSAACILWRPELVMSRDYQGLIPGLRMRYAGLSNHANALGPMVTVFLLCLWSKPFERRWLTRLGWMVGLGSLFLSQSKSSWIAFVLCGACLAAYRYQDNFGLREPIRRLSIFAPLLILALMGMASAIAISVMFGGAQERFSSFFTSSAGADLLTFTGRDQIWEVALQEWRANPVFGYGLTIWDEVHRIQIGMPWATHAHNQLFQSLSSAGIVGAVGLTVYAIVLLIFGLKTSRSSRGLSLALVILLFARSISEVPLTLIGYGTEQLTHLLLLMVIGANYSARTLSVQASGTVPDRKPVLT